jgi:beta-carotene 3-hydroxylase
MIYFFAIFAIPSMFLFSVGAEAGFNYLFFIGLGIIMAFVTFRSMMF